MSELNTPLADASFNPQEIADILSKPDPLTWEEKDFDEICQVLRQSLHHFAQSESKPKASRSAPKDTTPVTLESLGLL